MGYKVDLNKYTAIAFGNDHTNTLGVVQSLSIQGVKTLPLLWGEKTGIIAKSKFVKQFLGFKDAKDCVNFLLSNPPAKKIVIVPCCDEAAILIDNKKHLLKSSYCFQTSNKYSMLQLFKKDFQVSLAKKYGMSVPVSYSLNKDVSIPNDFKYPGIIKPIVSVLGNKGLIRIVNNKKDIIDSIRSSKCDFVLQSYIDKQFDVEYFGFRSKNGKTYIPGQIVKTRLFPEKIGLGTMYLTRNTDDLLKIKIAKLLDEIDYYGLFSFEFARTSNGENVFFEFNLRNDGALPCLTLSGFNLVYYYYCDQMGIGASIPDTIKELRILHLIRHHLSFFHKNISYKEWRYDIKNNDGLFQGGGNDKKPLRHIIRKMILRKMKFSRVKYYSQSHTPF